MQRKKIFFDSTPDRRLKSLPPRPSDDEIRVHLFDSSSDCPLNNIICGKANAGNMEILQTFAFTALKRGDRSCRDCNFGIYAQSGQGKTYVVKQFAKTIGIPFVFVQSKSLKNTWMLFEMIRDRFDQHEHNGRRWPPIEEVNEDEFDYALPPCIVFFDEAHALSKSMMTAGLLNAMESGDGTMVAKPEGANSDAVRIDCSEVCWIAATTEKGMLFDAFENRLTSIEWASARKEELVQIVKMAVDQRYENGELEHTLPEYACEIVTRYQRVPREAVQFAELTIQKKDVFPNFTWEDAASSVAKNLDIDEGGLTKKQVNVMSALGTRPIAESRLPSVAKCRKEQLQRYVLPPLMEYNEIGPLVISLPGRGMCLTESGLKELEKRGIGHNGHKVTVEYFESLRS